MNGPRARILLGSALLAAVLVSLPAAVAAPGAPARSGYWYYKVGGAESISAAANANIQQTRISGSIDLRHIYSCGNFNPIKGVLNQLDNLKDKAKNLLAGLAAAATNAVASLPALILQRANPGLYDLYQNAILEAEAVVSLANKSCEQMEAEIAQGKNPYEDWVNVAKGYSWKVRMGNGGSSSAQEDVVTAKKEVEDEGGKNGVPWAGGKNAGGTNQAPIRVVGDTVLAGYNLELGRGVTDTTPAGPAFNTTGLAKLWPAPNDAVDYGRYVLGDVDLHVDKQNDRASVPGHGLLPRIEKDKADLVSLLRPLVSGADDPKPDALEKVSPPGTLLTREVVEAIRHLPTVQEREVAIQKLGEETAIQSNVERALMLRRLLLTGRLEPNIYGSPAGPDLNLAVDTLNRDIDNVLYESRVRREIFAQTAQTLLGLQGGQTDSGDVGDPSRRHDPKPVSDGGAAP